ncbi:MAG: dipeptide/oligopeptide/nickel ABC transporter ATP-binding protein [Sporomusaceae bacterium]|nr:dipeptide/oligopeptide/nickel ABC transporter ATP-binding protein [Sporomusaceae bacterium]
MLKIDHLSKEYRLHKSWLLGHEKVQAVSDVSLEIAAGETLGLVGESGCGKSTLAKIIAMLEAPSAGKVVFNGKDLFALPVTKQRYIRKDLQIVFQDTLGALNPRQSIYIALEEPLQNFSLADGANIEKAIEQALAAVRLPRSILARYPGELSGGERQRVCLAKALIVKPRFLILDEATSGLDVIIQNQILQLLRELKQELNLTYLFITHNLKLAAALTDRIAVMYQGKIVEILPAAQLSKATEPYTQKLLAAVLIEHPRERGKKH